MGKGCLRCGKEFKSLSLFNRLCPQCNRANLGLSKFEQTTPYKSDLIIPVNPDAGRFRRRSLKPIGLR
jgi:hypothetical protein